jgi:hypothetical protein
MADSINNLNADWAEDVGINLNWDAAADVTINSQYEIFILQNTGEIIPQWVLVTVLESSLVYNSTFSSYSLSAPATYYSFPWADYTVLLQDNLIAPGSVAFRIVHVDVNGAASIGTNISVFRAQVFSKYGPPHLDNQIILDSLGQVNVNPQDSYEEIANTVSMFMGTSLGQRTAVPSYGLEDLPFNQLNVNSIQKQLIKWEPRALVSLNVAYDNNNQATLNVKVTTNSGGS